MTTDCGVDIVAGRMTHTLVLCACKHVSEGQTVHEAVEAHNRHIADGPQEASDGA